MSMNRQKFSTTFDVSAGTEKELFLTVEDPDTGEAKDLSDTNVYATGIVKIYKPDGTQIGTNMAIAWEDRAAGIVSFVVTDTHTDLDNAGNWIGKAVFSNITPKIIDQQEFALNIIESH